MDELNQIISKYEKVSYSNSKAIKARATLAHEIDSFLEKNYLPYNNNYCDLLKARRVISKLQLPLTQYIFQKESGVALQQKISPKPSLFISPPISITVNHMEKALEDIELQCDLFDQKQQSKIKEQYVQSLQEIRKELITLSDRHQLRKARKKITSK